jgi:hypothetical protein
MFACVHKKGYNPSESNSTYQYLRALIEESLRAGRTTCNEKRHSLKSPGQLFQMSEMSLIACSDSAF